MEFRIIVVACLTVMSGDFKETCREQIVYRGPEKCDEGKVIMNDHKNGVLFSVSVECQAFLPKQE